MIINGKMVYRWSYLHYNQFSVRRASEEYPLTVGGFTGADTDMFNFSRSDSLNGMKFFTPDNNNDMYTVMVTAHYQVDGGSIAVSALISIVPLLTITHIPAIHPVVFTEMKIIFLDLRIANC